MLNALRPAGARGRSALLQATGYYLAFASFGLTEAALGPALPSLVAQTGAQLDIISWLFTARGIGYLMGSLGGGRLYDRLPGHYVMAAALLIMGLAVAMIPFVPLIALLALVAVLWGLGQGSIDVGGNTLVVWIFGRSVGPFMSTLHFAFGLGAFVSPLFLAISLARGGGIAPVFLAMGAFTVPVAVYLLSQASPTRSTPTDSRDPVTFDRRVVGLVALFLMLIVGIEASYGGWVSSYAMETHLADEAQAATRASAFWGALTAGRLASIPLAARFRPRTLLAVDLAGMAAGLAVIIGWAGSDTALWIGTIILGVSVASAFPSTISLAERRSSITGAVTSWFMVGASLGGMVFPRLIGQLFTRFSPAAMPLALGGLSLLTIITFALLVAAPRRRPGEHLETRRAS